MIYTDHLIKFMLRYARYNFFTDDFPRMVWVLYVYAFVLGTAITLMIITKLIERSNAISGIPVSFDEYSPGVHYHAERDRADRSVLGFFMSEHAKSPFGDDDSSNTDGWDNSEDDIYGDLPEVDIPLFKPLDQDPG